jgi:hypothetical protein
VVNDFGMCREVEVAAASVEVAVVVSIEVAVVVSVEVAVALCHCGLV